MSDPKYPNNDEPIPATQPSVTTDTKTPLERLFLYYSHELTKKYHDMMASIDTYNQALNDAGQDITHVASFRRQIEVWGEDMQKGFAQWEATFGELSGSADEKLAQLQTHVETITAVTQSYQRLYDEITRYQISPTDQNAIQLIKSHHKDITQLKKDLADNIDRLTETMGKDIFDVKTELEGQIGIEVNARHLRERAVANARAMLEKRITELQRYLVSGVQSNQINFHDVYGYLRLAIENCPAEAIDHDLITKLGALKMTLDGHIASAIKTGKKRERHYKYEAPQLAINRLYEFVQERQKGGR